MASSATTWKVFEHLIHHNVQVDGVIIFSDMPCYNSGARSVSISHAAPGAIMAHSLSAELDAYRQINPAKRVLVYSVNLASQNNSCQFAPEQPVVELAGWNGSIFQFSSAMEVGQDIVQHIPDNY